MLTASVVFPTVYVTAFFVPLPASLEIEPLAPSSNLEMISEISEAAAGSLLRYVVVFPLIVTESPSAISVTPLVKFAAFAKLSTVDCFTPACVIRLVL